MIQITKKTTVKDLVEMASKNTLVEVLESYEKFIRADEKERIWKKLKGKEEFWSSDKLIVHELDLKNWILKEQKEEQKNE